MKTIIVTLMAVFIAAMSCFAESTTDKEDSAMRKKLESMIIPAIDFQETKIDEVVRQLVVIGKKNDFEKTGVNIALMDKENKSTITLSLKNVSILRSLKLVAEMAGLSLEIEGGVVVLRKPTVKE